MIATEPIGDPVPAGRPETARAQAPASAGGRGLAAVDPSGPPAGDEGGAEVLAAGWPGILDELESDMLAAESLLARNRAEEIAAWGSRSGDWLPPAALGPLPEELRARAARLLQHQLAVAERLVERITQSQQQRELTARMRFAPKPVAAFFDEAL